MGTGIVQATPCPINIINTVRGSDTCSFCEVKTGVLQNPLDLNPSQQALFWVILALWSVGPNGPFPMVKYVDGSATRPNGPFSMGKYH